MAHSGDCEQREQPHPGHELSSLKRRTANLLRKTSPIPRHLQQSRHQPLTAGNFVFTPSSPSQRARNWSPKRMHSDVDEFLKPNQWYRSVSGVDGAVEQSWAASLRANSEETLTPSSSAAKLSPSSSATNLRSLVKSKQRQRSSSGVDKTRGRIKKLYHAMDKNEKGSIDASKLQSGLKSLGVIVTAKQLNKSFKSMDINPNGKLEFPEFEYFIRNLEPDHAERTEVNEAKEQIVYYAKMLAAGYEKSDPWIPHIPSKNERKEFCQQLFKNRCLVGRELTFDVLRGSARIINLPEIQPGRRAMLHDTCVVPLRAAGVNVKFHDGCVGWRLPLDKEKLLGGVQEICYDDMAFTVDTSRWKDTWSHQDFADVELRMAMMDWFPLAWLSFPKDVMKPQTPGFVGGHISHVGVWREAWEANLDYVMILEDDAVPIESLCLTWCDIWNVIAVQLAKLKELGIGWDILYVGHTPSYTREGEEVTPLIRRAGYCLRTHSYCLSRDGIGKLLSSKVSTNITHRPQDEVLASLTLLSNGLEHPRKDFDSMLRDLASGIHWRPLLFKFDGLTLPLEDVEDTARSKSNTACMPQGLHDTFALTADPLLATMEFESVD